MNLSTQLSQAIESLPATAQAHLLAIAQDWVRSERQGNDAGYDEALISLLDQRAAAADRNPEALTPAKVVLDRLAKKWDT